ncbi:MAG: hypothetical protein ACXW53_24785, partial [Candidatus Binatia bacterium]
LRPWRDLVVFVQKAKLVTSNYLHRKQLQTLALYHRECQLTCVEDTVDRIKSIRSPHSNDLLLKPTRSAASGRRSGAGSGEDLRSKSVVRHFKAAQPMHRHQVAHVSGDAINTIVQVVAYCTPTNMRQSVRKPSVGCFRGASATMRGVWQARQVIEIWRARGDSNL